MNKKSNTYMKKALKHYLKAKQMERHHIPQYYYFLAF